MYGGLCLYLHSLCHSLKECAPLPQSSTQAGLGLPGGEDGQQDARRVGVLGTGLPWSVYLGGGFLQARI